MRSRHRLGEQEPCVQFSRAFNLGHLRTDRLYRRESASDQPVGRRRDADDDQWNAEGEESDGDPGGLPHQFEVLCDQHHDRAIRRLDTCSGDDEIAAFFAEPAYS